jgi:hypothetical protein
VSETATRITLSEWELDVLRAVQKVSSRTESNLKAHKDYFGNQTLALEDGWTTSATVKEELKARSLATRHTLRRLADWGFLNSMQVAQAQCFKLSATGIDALLGQLSIQDSNLPIVDSSNWTGVVSPTQIGQVLNILSEIEDICETIVENEPRAQILGLVRALEILLDLPNPPRSGIVELIRDPAFANIVQIAACLAAIVAAIRA